MALPPPPTVRPTRRRAARRDAPYWAVELVPQYLLGAATLVFVLTKWNAVRAAMDSLQAVAINTAVLIGWLALSLLLMPWLVKRQAIRVVVVSVAAVAPAGPVRLRSAALRGIDHRASGTASIIRRPDGAFVVGLEDIDIEPGPDYRVYVVPGDTERTSEGAVELDALRGNQGTQFYDVPAGVDVGMDEWTVLVWCQRFAVPVAAAVPA